MELAGHVAENGGRESGFEREIDDQTEDVDVDVDCAED